MNRILIKNKEGFTLIEVLISMSIFSLLIIAVMAIYLSFNNTQIRTTASQQLLNDSQYAMDLMIKEIRNNSIVSYAPNSILCRAIIQDGGVGSPKQCIIMEKENGQTFAFTTYDSGSGTGRKLLYVLLDCSSGYPNCANVDVTSSAVTELLSSNLNNINLDNLFFSITPNSDPFISGGPNQQPKVTIKMTTSYISGNQIQNVGHTFQTTISSRIYRR